MKRQKSIGEEGRQEERRQEVTRRRTELTRTSSCNSSRWAEGVKANKEEV